jgi:F plasmid transfer operon protein TraF
MHDSLTRLAILAGVILLIAVIVWSGRLFVNGQRKLALAAAPLAGSPAEAGRLARGRVRILFFSSADCSQCHTLQQPALRRLQELRGEEIDVVEIDASSSPGLARRYHILTLPSTVVLNDAGEPHAVNYGFANVKKLREQVETVIQK